MQIAIHGRSFKPITQPFIQAFFDELHRKNIGYYVSEVYANILAISGISIQQTYIYSSIEVFPAVDFVFSLGGDGTLLETVTQVAHHEIPIVGINVGRLGFLATIKLENMLRVLDILESGNFSLDHRTLVALEGNANYFDGLNFGLNEFTVTKTDSSSMIVVHTFLNGEFLNSYWADGLVVATPTGSTGYGLSAGGPLMLPHTNDFLIAPLCPHNLSVRPIIVPDDSVITMEIESRSGNFLASFDSRSKNVEVGNKLVLRKGNFKAKLVQTQDNSFLDTLRTKLNWGADTRNW